MESDATATSAENSVVVPPPGEMGLPPPSLNSTDQQSVSSCEASASSIPVPPPSAAAAIETVIEPQNPFETAIIMNNNNTAAAAAVQSPLEGQPQATPERSFTSVSVPASSTPPSIPEYHPQDDEHTEPSSTNPASETEEGHYRTTTSSSFSRFVENTRRRFSATPEDDDDDDELGGNDTGALIYGYLQKLGRNGKWQTRWFETDGECLSYYKSQKRIKLLATLDLDKVSTLLAYLHTPDCGLENKRCCSC